MAEQPDVLRRLITTRSAVHDLVERVAPHALRGTALIGRGSSENALQFGRYLFELGTGVPSTLVAPSVHSIYGDDVDYVGYLGIAASQSGLTPEAVETAAWLRRCGATTIALTANVNTPLARVATVAIDLQTGIERAVPATKTFLAQLAAIAMVAEAVGRIRWSNDDWHAAPAAVEEALRDIASIHEIVVTLPAVHRVVLLGRGIHFAIAREGALKIEETAGLAATAYPATAFLHGPIASLGHDSLTIGFAPPGRAGDNVVAVLNEVRERDLPVVTIGRDQVSLPGDLPEALSALVAAVRGQQLALALALARGHDPDHPAGLQKVTLT